MKRLLFVLFIGITGLGFGQEPTFDWGISINAAAVVDSDNVYYGHDFDISNNSEIYLVGQFFDSISFDNDQSFLFSDGGGGFITKFDESGIFQWSKQISTSSNGRINNMQLKVASDGNLFIMGTFETVVGISASAYINTDNPNQNIITHTPNENASVFLVCLDSSGNFLWSRDFSIQEPASGFSVALSSFHLSNDNKITITADVGKDAGGTLYFGGQPLYLPWEYYSSVILTTDILGNVLWFKYFEDEHSVMHDFLQRSPFLNPENFFDNQIICWGAVDPNQDVEPDPNSQVFISDSLITANEYGKSVILIFSEDGTLVNHYKFEQTPTPVGAENEYSQASTIIGALDVTNDFLLAYFSSLIFSPNSSLVDVDLSPDTNYISLNGSNGFIIKYDNNMNELWSKEISGMQGLFNNGNKIFTEIILKDDRTFFRGNSSTNTNYNNTYDICTNECGFLIEINSDGELIWSKNFEANLVGLKYLNGDFYLFLYSNNTVIDLNPDNGTYFSTNYGAMNYHIVKLSSDGTSNLTELNSNQSKELIKIVNLLGQEVEYIPNTVLIYQYSDGTSEKVFTIED